MGCLATKSSKPEYKLNKYIEQEILNDKAENDKKINFLLIGAGDSGKSTIARQIKIIHNNGFSKKEQEKFQNIINETIIQNMQSLIANLSYFKQGTLTGDSKVYADEILALKSNILLDQQLGKKIKTLWENPLIKNVYENRSLFHIPDTIDYYFEKIESMCKPNYLPTEEDILNCRVRSTGITTTKFTLNDHLISIIDVGGQRCERKKWISCFEDVAAVLFVSSMSEYNQKLFEDEDMNRMHESLLLFEEISNSRWFTESSIILFLNKVDLFKEKIQKFDLNVCFPEYKGGLDFDNASKMIKKKFLERVVDKEKNVFVHYTCATDTTNIQHVFDSLKDIIIPNTSPNNIML
ncbi:guanine nucleotide-binding protein g(o) subunit alpha [Anaeramoeba flamelloides]|uniref:Guanine nucleotide-binding protein g(O) subunit alpha n=1 Tax=Anaeramoeba flamelloides TaxID=1746091 RepID=A0AAV7YUX7_9EUKA|nr:guanine nucleotide-binding protein g(o) subunit alpha [Anaeramoeba flamelloides]KAJ6242134.1 guanine nucleotide-binding protein g(o) subunit alpha [Anaeramoeba flamelloides]